jgi:hypothetical protein
MFGRSLYVPHSYGGVARFAFPELCAQPVGAADYIALCQRYHTVVITDVPQMSMRIRDQARFTFFEALAFPFMMTSSFWRMFELMTLPPLQRMVVWVLGSCQGREMYCSFF